jgi:hypothetical protein
VLRAGASEALGHLDGMSYKGNRLVEIRGCWNRMKKAKIIAVADSSLSDPRQPAHHPVSQNLSLT